MCTLVGPVWSPSQRQQGGRREREAPFARRCCPCPAWQHPDCLFCVTAGCSSFRTKHSLPGPSCCRQSRAYTSRWVCCSCVCTAEQRCLTSCAHLPVLQVLQQSQEEEQQSSDHHQQQQDLDLDLTGLAVPVLPRRRLTGPVLLMPEPDPAPPGMTPQQAAAAAVAAARAALPPENELLETLLVPAGCLQLHSWQESAAAEDPPGEVAASIQLPRAPAAAGARTAGAAAGATAAGVDADLLQRGSEVLVTLTVMDTSRRLASVQQEIQVGWVGG